jgi:hypothetical protein
MLDGLFGEADRGAEERSRAAHQKWGITKQYDLIAYDHSGNVAYLEVSVGALESSQAGLASTVRERIKPVRRA